MREKAAALRGGTLGWVLRTQLAIESGVGNIAQGCRAAARGGFQPVKTISLSWSSLCASTNFNLD